jgi:hypothetical protein
MPKVCALFALLTTFVFANANAPTYQLWRGLPSAAASTEDAEAIAAGTAAHAHLAFATGQELTEDDRFEVDELFLPKLNVELPELFDWSDIDNAYYASAAYMSYDMDSYAGAAFRFASVGSQLVGSDYSSIVGNAGSARIAGASRGLGSSRTAGKSASSNPSRDEPGENAPDEIAPDEIAPTGTAPDAPHDVADDVEEHNTDRFAYNDETGTDRHGDGADPIETFIPTLDEFAEQSKSIVQVPAPGALGLFVLGLAGMRLAGRKKNRSG